MNRAPTITIALASSALAAWLAGAGCTQVHVQVDRPINWSQDACREGEMRYGEALELFGPPAAIGPAADGFAMLYERIEVHEDQIGLSIRERVIGFFKLAGGIAKANRRATLLVFDQDGVLQSATRAQWQDDLGRGAGIQLIVEAHAVVDSSALTEADSPGLWGSALLRPLPEALNSGSSLDVGDNGLQMRGAPEDAGQSTLEMHDPSDRKSRH